MHDQPERGGLDDAEVAALFDQVPELVIAMDADGRILHVNQAVLTTMGWSRDELIGSMVFDLVHPDDVSYMVWSWQSRQENPGEPGLVVQGRARNADGSWRACEVVGRTGREGDPWAMVISARDISRQSALADSPARLRSMIDRTTDIVLLLDPHGSLVFANRRVTALYGHDHDRIVGREWTSLLDADDVGRGHEWFDDLVRAGDNETSRVVLRLVGTDGMGHELEWHGANQIADPVIGGVIVNGRDITDLATMQRQLRDQNSRLLAAATHDRLTGLLNRPAFVEQVGGEIERRRTAPGDHEPGELVVLFCDLDGFKSVNDEFGHATGDRVLTIAAQRLRSGVRDNDVVARYGGDEFTVLLAGVPDPDLVAGLVERLRAAMAEPVAVGGAIVRIGVTIGVARGPEVSTDVDSMLHAADMSMYEQKRAHRGGGAPPAS